MTPNQFFTILSQITESRVFSTPVELRVNEHDAMAARLLLWLQEQMPPEATQGDLEDVLDAAKWWSVLFGSMHAVQPQQVDGGLKP